MRFVPIALAGLILLTGCTLGGSHDVTGGQHTTPVPPGERIPVRWRLYRLSPAEDAAVIEYHAGMCDSYTDEVTQHGRDFVISVFHVGSLQGCIGGLRVARDKIVLPNFSPCGSILIDGADGRRARMAVPHGAFAGVPPGCGA
jgi:hypothetical protein